MAIRSFRRSAYYINKLTTIANAKLSLDHIVKSEIKFSEIEKRRGEDIDLVYKYIERSALVGAVRIFDNDWMHKDPKIRNLLFKDEEIKSYLMVNGFDYSSSYSTPCIEWYGATKKEDELK
jgi:hypothetical protein